MDNIQSAKILLQSQYWKNEWLDSTIITFYFDGSNNIFTDCIPLCEKFDIGLRNYNLIMLQWNLIIDFIGFQVWFYL